MTFPPQLDGPWGTALVGFDHLLDRLQAKYPHLDRGHLAEIARREHDALTGGNPVAVPAVLESCVDEVLEPCDEARIAC